MTGFTRHTPETASPEGRKLLEGIQKSYGFIPELFAYMIEAPIAVEAYVQLNSMLSRSSFSPAQLQIALLAVSVKNGCAFCAIAHEAMGRKAGVDVQTIAAIKNSTEVQSPADRALVHLTQTIVEKRGWVDDQELQQFLEAGFTRQQVFELMVVVAIKTLSNYSNHLTRPEPNKELLAMIA
ncbi:MAG: carboxymuconolactone decarboxylase family protein [Pseudohongiellaceae bacterium]